MRKLLFVLTLLVVTGASGQVKKLEAIVAKQDRACPIKVDKVATLSGCYRYGFGTEVDMKKEQYYLEEAAKYNDEVAMQILEN